MRKIFLLIALLWMAAFAEAGVFKCQTPEGFAYSEQPCPKNTKALDFHTSAQPSSATGGSTDAIRQQMSIENSANKRNRDAMEKNAADATATDRKIKCTAARHNLAVYQRQQPIFTQDKNGERVYLEDDTRAAKIDSEKRAIDANCDS